MLATLLPIAPEPSTSAPQSFYVGPPSLQEAVSPAIYPPSFRNITGVGAILAMSSSLLTILRRGFHSFLSLYLDHIASDRPKFPNLGPNKNDLDHILLSVHTTNLQTTPIYVRAMARAGYGCGLGHGFPWTIRPTRRKLAEADFPQTPLTPIRSTNHQTRALTPRSERSRSSAPSKPYFVGLVHLISSFLFLRICFLFAFSSLFVLYYYLHSFCFVCLLQDVGCKPS